MVCNALCPPMLEGGGGGRGVRPLFLAKLRIFKCTSRIFCNSTPPPPPLKIPGSAPGEYVYPSVADFAGEGGGGEGGTFLPFC